MIFTQSCHFYQRDAAALRGYFFVLDCRRPPQHREVYRVRHRLVTGCAGMQMVAGVIAFAELTGMTWIAHRSVKIENAVKCAAGANPLIQP